MDETDFRRQNDHRLSNENTQVNQRMKTTRTRAGVLATIVWIFAVSYLAYREVGAFSEMAPNEWGDFFAGVFAPLAFLWLVLGYLQQGDELRLSTDALRLQAEELRNSVEQQRALVQVSREQVESEREALQYERRLRADLSEPKFSVTGGGGAFRGDGHCSYHLSVVNTGHDALAFSAEVQLLGGPWRTLLSLPLFEKGKHQNIRVEHPAPLEEGQSRLVLKFTDGLGRQRTLSYGISRESDHPHAGLIFQLLTI